jgi:hypothetical protein
MSSYVKSQKTCHQVVKNTGFIHQLSFYDKERLGIEHQKHNGSTYIKDVINSHHFYGKLTRYRNNHITAHTNESGF